MALIPGGNHGDLKMKKRATKGGHRKYGRYAGTIGRLQGASIEPERKLYVAVILQTIEDLEHKPSVSCTYKGKKNGRTLGRKCDKCASKRYSRWWLFKDRRGSEIDGTFEYVCEICGFDPQYLRKLIKEALNGNGRKSSST